MLKRSIICGLALSTLFLPAPVSFGAAANAGGDHGNPEKVAELRGHAQELMTQFLADVEAETKYECNGKCAEEGCTEECPWASSPAVQLTSLLGKGPEAIEAIRPVAAEAIGAKSTTDKQAGALIGMLLETRNGAVVPVAEAMFEEKPEAFCSDCITGFCEMGSESLLAPLAKRVKKGEASVAAAAFLASEGDLVGKKLLVKAVKVKALDATNALDVMVAADAVERHLGKKGASLAARQRVHAATLAALDAGELDRARHLAVAAKIAHGASMSSTPVYSMLAWRHAKTMEKLAKSGELAKAEQIFELIEEVTPIG